MAAYFNKEEETFAIVGGGFTGATLAAQLLRQASASAPVRVVVIENSSRAGRGLAYSTQCSRHLLNVPAENMSAFPDEPTHFLSWARLNYDSGVNSCDFLSRRLYGQYIESVLRDQEERSPGQLQWIADEATAMAHVRGVAEIRCRSGRRVFANKVVLALGNFPASDPYLPGRTDHHRRYVSSAWASDALNTVPQDGNVLLIGSGLTSVDQALALRQQEFRGVIHMLSRHGLLPRTHNGPVALQSFSNTDFPRTARGLLRMLLAQIKLTESSGGNWRSVIDSLRPVMPSIWRSLPLDEKRRFLRHLRSYWDTHRHRVAPVIGSVINTQLQSGKIKAHAGRITAYREGPAGAEVTYRDRKTGKLNQLCVDRVINCTGPESDCRKISSPLLTNLMEKGSVRPDELFQGLDVAENGALIDSDGVASNFLYTAGPFRKGQLWESVAVPELREQVAELAGLLTAGPQPAITEQLQPGRTEHLLSAIGQD